MPYHSFIQLISRYITIILYADNKRYGATNAKNLIWKKADTKFR